MLDDRQPPVDDAFAREARIGLTIVAILLMLFFYVAFGRLSGWNRPRPLAMIGDQTTIDAQAQRLSQQQLAAAVPESAAPAAIEELENVPSIGNPARPTAKDRQSGLSHQSRRSDETTVSRVPSGQFQPASPRSLSSFTASQNTLRSAQAGHDPDSAKTEELPSAQPNLDSTPAVFDRLSDFVKSRQLPLRPPVKPTFSFGDANENRLTKFEAPMDRNSGLSLPDRSTKGISKLGPAPLSISPPSATNENNLAEPIPTEIHPSGSSRLRSSQANGTIDKTSATQPAGISGTAPPEFVLAHQNDSFWSIAQRVYDDGRLFNALFQENRSTVPSFEEIPAGTRIMTPPLSVLRSRWPNHLPEAKPGAVSSSPGDASLYVTRDNETLFAIAREQLGQASRYLEILELNRGILPQSTDHNSRLPSGTKLRLPVPERKKQTPRH